MLLGILNLIHFETIDVSVLNVYEVREKPLSLLIWDSSNTTLHQICRKASISKFAKYHTYIIKRIISILVI